MRHDLMEVLVDMNEDDCLGHIPLAFEATHEAVVRPIMHAMTHNARMLQVGSWSACAAALPMPMQAMCTAQTVMHGRAQHCIQGCTTSPLPGCNVSEAMLPCFSR